MSFQSNISIATVCWCHQSRAWDVQHAHAKTHEDHLPGDRVAYRELGGTVWLGRKTGVLLLPAQNLIFCQNTLTYAYRTKRAHKVETRHACAHVLLLPHAQSARLTIRLSEHIHPSRHTTLRIQIQPFTHTHTHIHTSSQQCKCISNPTVATVTMTRLSSTTVAPLSIDIRDCCSYSATIHSLGAW